MFSSSFAKFTSKDIPKLKDYSYEYELEGFPVKAVVQFEDVKHKINEKEVRKGIAIAHRMRDSSKLVEKKDGKFMIETEVSPKPVWTEFEIIGNELIRVYSGGARDIVLQVLSHGLGQGRTEYIKPVSFDLERIRKDHKGHWIGSIFDRDGHMQSGTFYGDYIERDDVIGKCWKKNKKSQVGFLSEYFGNEITKVRVTIEGTVQIMKSGITDEVYLQFVMNELSKYMIEPSRSMHRRTS